MAGVDAFGTVWEVEWDDLTFTAVGDITNIDVMDVSVDVQDVSAHDSPSQWREKIGGMKDGGELSMELNFDPTNHAIILTNLGVEHSMRFTLTDTGAASVTFQGFVSGMGAAAPYDDKLSASVTVTVTGPVTITP
jgi:predicted secreted protein